MRRTTILRLQFATGDYCDREDVMRQFDPRVLYFDNDEDRQERVENRLEQYEDFP